MNAINRKDRFPHLFMLLLVQVHMALDARMPALWQCPEKFGVNGGGSYCQGDTGVSVRLAGSEPGMLYTLLLNDSIRLDTLPGSGGILTWSPVRVEGTYRVISENPADSCMLLMNDSAVVTVLDLPVLSFEPVSITCFGDHDGSISAEVTGGTAPYQLQWNGPAGFTSTQSRLTGLGPGDYSLSVTDSNQCSVTGPVQTITEPDLLVANLDMVHDLTEYEEADGSVDLTITGGTAPYMVHWKGTDDFTSTDEDPDSMSVGYYRVMVTDDHLCKDSILGIRLVLSGDPDELFIPEGFSPNGDGYNDRFTILGIEHYPDNELVIFNRQGVEILHRVNYRNDWDGRPERGGILGGDLLEGTYYYIFRYGNSQVRKGFLYINRE